MVAVINKDKCTGCESCVQVCPVQAITMVDGKADVNADTCVSCGACVGACSVEAITME